jgi:hypothetical protein
MPKARDPNHRQPNKAQSLDREHKAWQLRIEGHTFQQIGNALGVSKQGAYAIVSRAGGKERDQFEATRDTIRAMQFQRLEKLYRSAAADLEKSKEPRQRAIQRTNPDGSETVTRDIADQGGNINLYYAIMKIMADQRELTGMNVLPEQNPATTAKDLTDTDLSVPYKPPVEDDDEQPGKASQNPSEATGKHG